jgi:hypothetical protein
VRSRRLAGPSIVRNPTVDVHLDRSSARIGDRHTVPPGSLRLVERCIRHTNELGCIARVVRERRRARAQRDVGDPSRCGRASADAFAGGRALLAGTPGQDDRELLTSIPRRRVERPEVLPQPASQPPEDVVADLMAMRVVQFLEAVDVEHHERHLLAGALSP